MSTAQPPTEPSTTQNSETAVAMNESRKVSDLWFIDGTLVLLAGTSRFRVYGGLLAKSSPVFQDMLAFPHPSDVECIDGCPVVRLEDKEQDLRYFLKALFDHELVHLHDLLCPFRLSGDLSRFFLPIPAKTTFEILSGILRLSVKY